MKMNRTLLILVLMCQAGALLAQGLPETDIFVGKLSAVRGKPSIHSVKNVTHRAGYDNQPSFTPDGESILFTEYLDSQSDIFRCNLKDGSIVPLTETKESEYSPLVMPYGKNFSVVRVEKDSTQRLWRFSLKPGGRGPEILFKDIKPVGYQAWIDSQSVALFVLGDTNTLHVADVGSGKDEKIVGEIGRSLHRVPGKSRTVSFVHKVKEKEWWIKEYDLNTKAIRSVVQTLPGREDFEIMGDGTLLMGDSSSVYFWRPGMQAEWQPFADLSGYGLAQISRMALSPGDERIAIVATSVERK